MASCLDVPNWIDWDQRNIPFDGGNVFSMLCIMNGKSFILKVVKVICVIQAILKQLFYSNHKLIQLKNSMVLSESLSMS